MSVVGGVSLIAVAVVLGVVGVFTLFLGIGFLILLLALILFIVGLVLIAQGDPQHYPPPGYYGHSAVMPAYPPAFHGYPGYPPPAPPSVPYPAPAITAVPAAERYCPSCGAGNLRVSAFCHKCGKPLPPPP